VWRRLPVGLQTRYGSLQQKGSVDKPYYWEGGPKTSLVGGKTFNIGDRGGAKIDDKSKFRCAMEAGDVEAGFTVKGTCSSVEGTSARNAQSNKSLC